MEAIDPVILIKIITGKCEIAQAIGRCPSDDLIYINAVDLPVIFNQRQIYVSSRIGIRDLARNFELGLCLQSKYQENTQCEMEPNQ